MLVGWLFIKFNEVCVCVCVHVCVCVRKNIKTNLLTIRYLLAVDISQFCLLELFILMN